MTIATPVSAEPAVRSRRSLRTQLLEMLQLRSQESLLQFLFDKARFPAYTAQGAMRYEFLEQMLESIYHPILYRHIG